LDLRRIYWEKSQRLEELEQSGEQSAERRELEHYVHDGWDSSESRDEAGIERRELEQFLRFNTPNYNYIVDKGWQAAVEHLADCILQGTPCELSTAEDGLRATMLSEAAIESRNRGEVVRTAFVSTEKKAAAPHVEVTLGKAAARRTSVAAK
jgi:hypothetical protein